MSEVLNYLDSKNIVYKLDGKEAILTCPECYKPKLNINIDSEVYQCWYCKAKNPGSKTVKGHLSQLKEIYGDVIHIPSTTSSTKPNQEEKDYTEKVEDYRQALLKDKVCLKYLYDRGITKESIIKFKLGKCLIRNDIQISIPIYEDGTPKLIKYRNLNPEAKVKYCREKGGKSILFNGIPTYKIRFESAKMKSY